jgi:hypothetical protein
MKILFAYYKHYHAHEQVPSYAMCMVRELRALGHDVIEIGKERFDDLEKYKRFDLLIDVDSGRDKNGKYDWHLHKGPVPIPSVAYFIDTHGQADAHARVASRADHVFFAVWDKRDIFSDHDSAHWAPCATDLEYFNLGQRAEKPMFNFGFYGSKGGLGRADPMIEICRKYSFTWDVRQIQSQWKVAWPMTGIAMGKCEALFNHGQRHDDPNQRVMESMAVGRVLITPNDLRSGVGHLFEPWIDYIPYEPYTCEGLERAMLFVGRKPEACEKIAQNAYNKVAKNHLIKHRVKQVMEVVNA